MVYYNRVVMVGLIYCIYSVSHAMSNEATRVTKPISLLTVALQSSGQQTFIHNPVPVRSCSSIIVDDLESLSMGTPPGGLSTDSNKRVQPKVAAHSSSYIRVIIPGCVIGGCVVLVKVKKDQDRALIRQ
ncbi:MAG: hypothetical protein NTX86_00570 [Candidatus Dependentiae bacterium]|nr:hypothetical protein [Candidatus Dependentiae bacterium]